MKHVLHHIRLHALFIGLLLLPWLGLAETNTTSAGNATSVDITYNAPSTGGWFKDLQLEAPRLPIPLENLTWSVVLPEGVSLENSSGDLAWFNRSPSQGKSLQEYLASLARLRNDRVAKADRLLQQAQGVLQRGSQEKARRMLSNIAYSQALDQASNEDARIQLEELETRQALLDSIPAAKNWC